MEKKPPLAVTLPMLYEHTGLNDTTLAAAVNKIQGNDKLKQNTVRRLSTGESEQPRDSTVRPVAEFFNMTIGQIKDVEFVRAYIGGDRSPDVYDRLSAVCRTLPPEEAEVLLGVAEARARSYAKIDEPQSKT